MTQTTHMPVPAYDEIVERNDIVLLKQPGDLAIVNGDLAITRRGDLMLHRAEYSAFFSLVNWWRFNYPVISVMFNAVFPPAAELERVAQDLEQVFRRAGEKSPHPMMSLDYDEYHRLNDIHGAQEVARDVYAGSIVMALANALQSFRADIDGNIREWNTAAPQFLGCSLGQVLIASANNVRHADEWQTTRPPTPQQLKSILVLSLALNEPLCPSDGSRHRFGRDICREILEVVCAGKMEQLEAKFFEFAKDLLTRKELRNGSRLSD